MIALLLLTSAVSTPISTPATSTSQPTSITSIDTSTYSSSSIEIIEPEEFDFGAWLSEYFTPEVVTVIVSVCTALGAVIKMASSLRELAKKHAVTSEEICEQVKKVLKNGIDDNTQKAINDLILPLNDSVNEIKPYLETFAKILALAQENTPESRLAILELIQKMGQTDQETIDHAKEEVKNQVIAEETKKEEAIAKLEDISSNIKPVE